VAQEKGSVTGSCEDGNEKSDSVRGEKFLN
jgi:hypothetical protein